MNIHVALYAGLSRYLPPGAQNRKGAIMRKGDTLAIFPPLAGGGPTRAAAASDPAPWERYT
jgi:hypothetical protein